MEKIKKLVLIAFILVISSCGLFRGTANKKINAKANAGIVRMSQFKKQGTFFWTHFDASKRASITFIDSLGHIKVLAENSPDAAFSKTIELLSKASAKVKDNVDVSAENQYKLVTEVAQLSKRNSTVNVLRDAMYRLSEAQFNGSIKDSGFYSVLFEKVLQTSVKIAQYEYEEQEQKTKSDSVNAIKEIELTKQKEIASKTTSQNLTKTEEENKQLIIKTIDSLINKIKEKDSGLSKDVIKEIEKAIANLNKLLENYLK